MQNHTDNLKLLELTKSESDSDSPQFSLPKRKVRFKKRFRPNHKTKSSPEETCTCQCMQQIRLVLNIILLIIVAVLIWFVTSLNTRVEDLQELVDNFKTGNKNLPETFQNIHTNLKSLESNITVFKQEFKKLSNKVEEISNKINEIQEVTNGLQKSVATAPELKQLPKDVRQLSQTLANMGSKNTAVESNVKELKEQYDSLITSIKNKEENINFIKNELDDDHLYMYNNLTVRVENLEDTIDMHRYNVLEDSTVNETAIQLINQTMTETEKHFVLMQNGIPTYNSLLNLTVACLINCRSELEYLRTSVQKLTRQFEELNKTEISATTAFQELQRVVQKLSSNRSESNSSDINTYQDLNNQTNS